MRVNEIKKIMEQYDSRPTKSKGQNFLIDQNILKKIIAAADLAPGDVVVEIGPGLGVLTEELCRRAKKVVAVELDCKLADFLRHKFKDQHNVEIIQGDILKYQGKGLTPAERKNYKIVANLPYNITSQILYKFLPDEFPPRSLTLMTQKEVAERMAAGPGEMNLLALLVQFYTQPKICFSVSRSCFWPSPKVDSAVINLDLLTKKEGINTRRLFALFKFGFAMKRKKLVNNLWRGISGDRNIFTATEREKYSKDFMETVFAELNLDLNIRAERLSLIDWQNILKKLTVKE